MSRSDWELGTKVVAHRFGTSGVGTGNCAVAIDLMLTVRHTRRVVNAVVFDLDGVLVDSEEVWDESRRAVTEANGGTWRDEATFAMQGMSAPEWSAYMRENLVVDLPAARISELVVGEVLRRLDGGVPVLPGATEALDRIGAVFPLGLASSANREVIEAVLERAGWTGRFQVTVSSEEVARGKPSPDVYLAAVHRLGFSPESCVAIEDSANGVRSALAAGLSVVAVPKGEFAPPAALLSRCGAVVRGLPEVTVELLNEVERQSSAHREARIDEAEDESFPASDPHSDWAGPAT